MYNHLLFLASLRIGCWSN